MNGQEQRRVSWGWGQPLRGRHRLEDPGRPHRRVGAPDRRSNAAEDAGKLDAATTILLVDDEPSVRWLIGRMLRAEGFNVVEAGSGVEALELCERHHVAVVVTDVRMPRMGGVELARRLAAAWLGIQVLFVTAYPSTDVDVPSARIVTKPFDPDEFAEIVRSLADKHRVEGGPSGDDA